MNDIQRNNKAGSILCAGRGCSLFLSDRPQEESHTPSPVASGEVGYMSRRDIEGDEAQLHSLRPPPPLHLASHRAKPGPLNTPACPVVKRGPRTRLMVRQPPPPLQGTLQIHKRQLKILGSPTSAQLSSWLFLRQIPSCASSFLICRMGIIRAPSSD